MKKTYVTPIAIANGEAVGDTKGSVGSAPDSGGLTQNFAPGAIGFNL